MKNNAIFIHSLFRSSSTYLFNVFRESSDLYYCYQEPDSEQLVSIDTNPNKLLTFDNKLTSHLRHPSLEKSYFEEIYQLKEHLTNLYSVAFSFEDFFPIGEHLPENQKNCFGAFSIKVPK